MTMQDLERIMRSGGTMTKRSYDGHTFYYVSSADGRDRYSINGKMFYALAKRLPLVRIEYHGGIERLRVGARGK